MKEDAMQPGEELFESFDTTTKPEAVEAAKNMAAGVVRHPVHQDVVGVLNPGAIRRIVDAKE